MLPMTIAPKETQDLQAVHVRHHHVKQYQIRQKQGDVLGGATGIRRAFTIGETCLLQLPANHLHH